MAAGPVVLFLDFDGVIARNIGGNASAFERLVPHRVAYLSSIVERTGCRVVVASTWRKNPETGLGLSAAKLEAALQSRGYTGEVDDITPYHAKASFHDEIAKVRGGEILAWIRDQKVKPSAIAVLDDVMLDGPIAPYVVQTVEEIGLTPAHVERAVALLHTPLTGRRPWAPAVEQVSFFADFPDLSSLV